jgi:twitching motility two-component system response regulator PilH
VPIHQRTKVFIVDDSKVVLMAARKILEAAGFEVITRSDPIGSTVQIMHERPDVVLLDVNMPLLEGHDIVRSIKRCANLRDTAVLLFSGRPESELQHLMLICGADGYIQKSTTPRQLAIDVRCWLLRRVQPQRAAV